MSVDWPLPTVSTLITRPGSGWHCPSASLLNIQNTVQCSKSPGQSQMSTLAGLLFHPLLLFILTCLVTVLSSVLSFYLFDVLLSLMPSYFIILCLSLLSPPSLLPLPNLILIPTLTFKLSLNPEQPFKSLEKKDQQKCRNCSKISPVA